MADNRYRERGSYGRSDSIFSDDDRGRGSRGYHQRGDRDDDRGFFQRAGEEVRSWFSDDDDDRHDRGERMNRGPGGGSYREHDQSGHYGGRTQSREEANQGRNRTGGLAGGSQAYRGGQSESWGGGSDWGRQNQGDMGQGSFTQTHPSQGGGAPFDDHYRSWRDQQIQQLDSEYDEYCRHRQQQFESDFGSWRQTRQGQGPQGGTASGRTGSASQSEGSTTAAQSGGASAGMNPGGATAQGGSSPSKDASTGAAGNRSSARGARSGKPQH